MNTEGSQEEQALRAQLEGARERVDGIAQDLRAVDLELEEMAQERHQYDLLHQACSALEQLSELGASGLFWDARGAGGNGEDHVRSVRSQVDVFQKMIREVDERRQTLVHALEREQNEVEFLEDDLYELKQREEERKLDWVVEREIDDLPKRATIMPWSRTSEDDSRFRRALALALLLSLLLGAVLPMIDLPLPDPWVAEEVPDRWTQLVREELPPPPPPPQEQAETEEQVEPDPEEPVVAEKTTPKEEPRKTAESKGILAFREKFSGLASSKAPARLGSDARISSGGEATTGRPTRNMVATQAPGSSGGINVASLSRDVGGNGTAGGGVQVARVTSSIGGVAGEDRPLSSGVAAGRTDEEIQIVFDRHKAALYRLYNRELRQDPTLKGQMVLRLTIEPDGTVSLCELQSSDMNAPELASQVVGRVRTFDFGAKDVPAITILYPIDFLPAS